MNNFFDKKLRLALCLTPLKDWESYKSLKMIREVAKTCTTYQEIADKLGWKIWVTTGRLKKYNIKPTGLKRPSKESLKEVSGQSYKPIKPRYEVF